MNSSINSARSDRGFALTDLLVVIATLALVAMVTVPALAGIQNKGGRLECANNLRQIGMESMVYAQENQGWLPIMTLGAANGGNGSLRNHMNGLHYTRFAYLTTAQPNTQITTNEPTSGGQGYQSLGYLYQDGQAGNGSIFFCPAMWGQFLQPSINHRYKRVDLIRLFL
jgi:type II secretory pathway pseudopilin PulG